MSKKHKHEEHVNHERWLVSYADFITLLFAFFVVLFSSSQVDRSKTNKMALAMEAAFDSFAIFKEGGGELDLVGRSENSKSGGDSKAKTSYDPAHFFKTPDEITLGNPLGAIQGKSGYGFDEAGKPIDEGTAFSRATQDLTTLLDRLKLQSAVSVTKGEGGITISMNESGMFESGSKELSKKSEEVLRGIGAVLMRLPGNDVRIEGHTDNRSNWSNTNWDLSVNRATSVVKWFLKSFDLNPARFSAVGYGEFHPVADNDTEEGRKKNRRVDLVIVSLNNKPVVKEKVAVEEKRAPKRIMTLPIPAPQPIVLAKEHEGVPEVKVAEPLAEPIHSEAPAAGQNGAQEPFQISPQESPSAPPIAPEVR